MKIKLDAWAFMPVRAHETDAGADLRSPIDAMVPARGSRVIDTGVHIQLPHGYVGMLKSKSGLNVGARHHHVLRGDKITQLVMMPCAYVGFERVEELEDSERGDGGFGSTGK